MRYRRIVSIHNGLKRDILNKMQQIFKKIVSNVLQFEAYLVLKKYKPKIIAVTGSVGKTSTKDAIFSVMSTSYYIRKSEKSFNSDIGIPLTILGCQNAWMNPFKWVVNFYKGIRLLIFTYDYPEWLVLEVGADRPNDIKNITKWLKPDVVVITAFAKTPVHVEFFKNREHLIREKRYLVEALKHDGALIINGDDDDAVNMKEYVKNISIMYGTFGSNDLIASDAQIYYNKNNKAEGITFKVSYEENVVPIVVNGTLGAQNIYSALASLAVGLSQKINIIQSGQALLKYDAPKGRMKIIDGVKNSTIIDDTYNSSPTAVASALRTLMEVKVKGKKIAVLGDMLELGKHSSQEHYEAGKLAGESADILITVGIRARKMSEGALDAQMKESNVFQCDDTQEAIKLLNDLMGENDFILVKGSQSIRMERIVKELMAKKELAAELLVRQEDEWQNKK